MERERGTVPGTGTEVSDGAGSRVRVALKGVRAVFHSPCPSPQTRHEAARSLREFLEAAGAAPAGEQGDA
jgi:hypothetical protein